ncbi:MAG: hypothetical protein AAF206_09540 [Bacteroidota bacterium]
MKNKLFRIAAIVTLAFTIVLAGCEQQQIINRLEGDWEVTSFTEDGVETINADFNSVTIEFEEYDGEEGDFNWVFIGTNGATVTLTGEYTVNGDGSEVDMAFQSGSLSGSTFEFDLEVDKEELELQGNVNGFNWIIQADRD